MCFKQKKIDIFFVVSMALNQFQAKSRPLVNKYIMNEYVYNINVKWGEG